MPPSGSLQPGAGPPQQGSTQTSPAGQLCSPHTGGAPVVSEPGVVVAVEVVVVVSVVGALVLVASLVLVSALLPVGVVVVVVVPAVEPVVELVEPGSPEPQAARMKAAR